MPSSTDMNFHDFNSLQRVLQNAGIDGRLAVIFTELYTQQLETAKQLDAAMNLMVSFADTLAQFTNLHEATQSGLRDLQREIHGGVEVHSEMVKPDDYKQ